jgi:prepilin-type N-terminal cleavage/methylation domain-containing protein
MKHALRRARGYTAVELLIAISIFGVGVSGAIAMQKVTAASNMHAKNLAVATHIAESWIDMLATDAVSWNSPSVASGPTPDIGETKWLQKVVANANTTNAWFLPDTTLRFGPGFDALGNPVNPSVNPDDVRFCSHLRLSWLYQPTASGNGLIRAEVRVFWPRDGQGLTATTCTTGQVTAVGGNVQTFHFVQKISAIRENG